MAARFDAGVDVGSSGMPRRARCAAGGSRSGVAGWGAGAAARSARTSVRSSSKSEPLSSSRPGITTLDVSSSRSIELLISSREACFSRCPWVGLGESFPGDRAAKKSRGAGALVGARVMARVGARVRARVGAWVGERAGEWAVGGREGVPGGLEARSEGRGGRFDGILATPTSVFWGIRPGPARPSAF